jgi:group I intron endonuclease
MAFVPSPEAVSCVYWVHRPEHTDILRQGYVGISKRFERRIWEHLKLTQNRYLKNAINKYGWDNLVKEKVLIGKEDYCLEIEAKLRPADKIGWNLVKGGNKPPINRWNLGKKGLTVAWNKGKAWNEEVKAKLSAGVAKLWQDPEYRQRMSDAHKGKPSQMAGKKHKPETIERMRLVKIGKPSGKKGMKMSQEHNDKMKELAKLQAWICPHCNTSGHSKGAGNRWHFDNCKGVR